jgi:diguanylate cyclase (GGDEF)-like protein
MYYASIGVLALLTLLIVNYNVLKEPTKSDIIPAHKAYKAFLLSVVVYYITDILWGGLYALNIPTITFIETIIYFIAVGCSVLLWTKFVNTYIGQKNKFSAILNTAGWVFLIIQIILLIINCFFHISFWFDDNGRYQTGIVRFIVILVQVLFFLAVFIYMIYITIKSEGEQKRRHFAIAVFSFVMVFFVLLSDFFPSMPFYSIGYMLGTCILHTFVLEDEKETRRKEIENLLKVEKVQELELGTTKRLAYTDPLTGVKNKMAYIDDVGSYESRIENNEAPEFGMIVFDLNDLKKINDTKGHDAGDQYIKTACAIICNQFKHSPIYRIGGDEFVAILRGKDYKNHLELIKSFNEKMEANLAKDDVVIACGFSEFIPNKDKSLLRVFERADKRMYERKNFLKELRKGM